MYFVDVRTSLNDLVRNARGFATKCGKRCRNLREAFAPNSEHKLPSRTLHPRIVSEHRSLHNCACLTFYPRGAYISLWNIVHLNTLFLVCSLPHEKDFLFFFLWLPCVPDWRLWNYKWNENSRVLGDVLAQDKVIKSVLMFFELTS